MMEYGNIPNMIQTGQFGYGEPMNLYQQQPSNIMGIGNQNYNQDMNNGYVFQPVQNSYNEYLNPYNQMNMYQQQPMQQQPYYYNQYQYNNYQQPSYGYMNNYYQGPFPSAPATGYGYQEYTGPSYQQQQLYNRYAQINHEIPQQNQYGYGGFTSVQQYGQNMMQTQQEQLKMMKIKAEIANACFGKELDEEAFDKKFNPNNPANRISDEELILNREFETMKYFASVVNAPPVMDTPAMSIAKKIQASSKNYHDYFDKMTMREYLDEHLWRLKREDWIEKNINVKQSYDLSSTYSSKDYNELLRMHSNNNPYINRLLDVSQYDNNLDDMELGITRAFDAERQKSVLNITVPEHITSKERAKARNNYFEYVTGQLIKKNERKNK